jgi:1,2-diacylglycerol 3-alpha-glucosyltransferase
MRVLMFTDTYHPQVNGVAACVSTLAQSLSSHGHSVIVCTVLARRGRPATLATTENRFPVIYTRAVTLPRYSDIRIAAPVSLAIGRIARRFHPDIIHCHTPFSTGWQGIQISNSLNIPVLGTHHTLFGEYVAAYSRLGHEINTRLAAWVRRYVATFYNLCDMTSSASSFLARDLGSSGLKRPLTIVPNPVDIYRFRPCASKPFWLRSGYRLVYFGRIAVEKNLHQLIAFVEPFLRRHSHATLEIIGEGPALKSLWNMTRECRLLDQIRFLGWLEGDALVRRVASADICVCASLTENQPVSLLESLACGVPVVALAAGGIPEIITDGEDGFLIEPTHATNQFAERLEQLTRDPSLLLKMGRQATATASRYSTAACLQATLATYQQTISVARRRQASNATSRL